MIHKYNKSFNKMDKNTKKKYNIKYYNEIVKAINIFFVSAPSDTNILKFIHTHILLRRTKKKPPPLFY